MTSLATIIDRIEQAITDLSPLVVAAELNADAAFQRRQLRSTMFALVGAKRLAESLAHSETHGDRRHSCEGAIPVVGDVISSVVGVTFNCAANVPRNPWPAERRA